MPPENEDLYNTIRDNKWKVGDVLWDQNPGFQVGDTFTAGGTITLKVVDTRTRATNLKKMPHSKCYFEQDGIINVNEFEFQIIDMFGSK